VNSLLIVDRYMPHNGGSRRYYHKLAQQLEDVVVLAGPQPGDKKFDQNSGVCTRRRIGIRPNYDTWGDNFSNPVLNVLFAYLPGMVAIVFWTLLEILQNRPKVIHAGGYAFAGLAARIWGPVFGIPTSVYAHGEDVSTASERRFFARFMKWVFDGMDAIVVNSINTANLVMKEGVEQDKINIACPGVGKKWFQNLPKSGELSRSLLKSSTTGPVLLTVGRLVRHKGHATVLESLPELLKRWPELTWVLVGTGPEKDRLHKRANELGVTGSIQFLAGLTDDELKGLYLISDIFVQPNGEANGMSEGYGMVFLEAGATGLPVVGGNNGGVPEVIRHGSNGFLVPPFDPAELTEALAMILENNSLRVSLGANGRKWAKTQTWENTLSTAVNLGMELSQARLAR